MFSLLRIALLLLLLAVTSVAQAEDPLVPPAGYLKSPRATQQQTSHFVCPTFPAPYTAELKFSSKYAGSDSARATLNPDAELNFHQQTAAITRLEKQVSQLVAGFARDGDPARVRCLVNGLEIWAQADALTSTNTNHTGRSMRKWALATLSSSWLQIQFSPSQPLQPLMTQAKNIQHWLGKLADLSVADWSTLPLARTNNHSYWAAWAIMATSVVTNRRDLFDVSLTMYRTAAGQVDDEGFLPHELRRKQRAFSYHNYAIQPLVMIALFARSNHVEVLHENNDALQRLANRIIRGFTDPDIFNRKAGITQDLAFLRQDGAYAWLEGWCTLTHCESPAIAQLKKRRPLHSTRLGGDLSWLFATQ
jgi:poly(beta-D-mannuronate) lyase